MYKDKYLMDLQRRINAFKKIGDYLREDFFLDQQERINEVVVKNPWFTKSNIVSAVDAWVDKLNFEMLDAWLAPYKLDHIEAPKNILIVMAGNIPLVGFHDFLTVLILGHRVVLKMSSKDNILIKLIIEELIKIDVSFKERIIFIDDYKNKEFDAVIATGNDNSVRYFSYYFKDLKKIIRKSRTSVALLYGTESSVQLKGLADDVFSYFGLGCRNISKVFLPKGYDLNKLFDAFYDYRSVIQHTKYSNNYDYHKTICLMGGSKLIENGFLLMKEDSSLFSPVAMLYYEYYDVIDTVEEFLDKNSDNIQCVVSSKHIDFGYAQRPNLWDYADGIDTVEFLRLL